MRAHIFIEFRCVPIFCDVRVGAALWTMYRSAVGITQVRGQFYQRIEHRLQIERRSTDDLEHVGGRRLLLEGFTQLAE